MNLYVNNNLALELPSDLAPQLEAHDNNKSDPRAELAAQFIPAGAQVLDLSENATLQTLLPGGCSYRDANQGNKKRPARGCDLNTANFRRKPRHNATSSSCSASLERVADIDNLFTHLRFCKRDIILSYCATDLAKDLDRAALGFTNHLSFYDLATLFDRYGFRIECTTPVDETQVLMRLTPTEWLAPHGALQRRRYFRR